MEEKFSVGITSKTEWMFYHLWKKSPVTKKCCEGILIPSTIFFRWAHAHMWYKMQEQLGIVRIKNEYINIDDIFKDLAGNNTSSGIVCSYTYKDSE